MTIEEIKERINTEGQQLLEKLQDTSAFNQISEKYHNWPSAYQKAFRIGSVALLVLLIFSLPLGTISTSSEGVDHFTEIRESIRDMLRVSREAANAPQLQAAPPAETLKAQIEARLKENKILPEQIKGINMEEVKPTGVPAEWISSGMLILLSKLTINQIVDVGLNFQYIHPNIKIAQMSVTANKEDPLYQDVAFRIFTLTGRSSSEPTESEPSNKKNSRSAPKRAKKAASEDE